MWACFMSLAVTVLDFVFSLSFVVKWMTSAVTQCLVQGTVFGDIDGNLCSFVGLRDYRLMIDSLCNFLCCLVTWFR